jgi:predicted CoA-binding protein
VLGERKKTHLPGVRMASLEEAVAEFLALETIAVAGVSREGNLPANHIFRKLMNAGYRVYPVNPAAREVEGVTCYPDLASVPEEIQGLVIAAPSSAAESLVEECVALGICRVWMHRSFGQGSLSERAVDRCREAGIAVIPGACPMMFLEPIDFGHRCIRWVMGVGRKLPTPEGFSALS